MYRLFTLIFLLTLLSSCYEAVQGIRLDKKVRVDKFYDNPLPFSKENFPTFALIYDDNSSLEYKTIASIIIKRFEKLGFVYKEINPDFKISYVYGNAHNKNYSLNNKNELSFQENYSYSLINNSSFIFNMNFYKNNIKFFEAYSYIKLDNYSIKNERYINIHDYFNCLINAILYNDDTENYINGIATQSFIILCDIKNNKSILNQY